MTAAAAPLDLAAHIPAELRTGKQFVAYRLEPRRGQPKPAKMPYSPAAPKGASSTDPSHWTTFDQALRYSHVAGLDGVMRAFVESDGMVGVDLDHCRDPETGELAAWAAAIVQRLDTYTELSPSGTGVHLWCYGTLPPRGRHKGDVEMYSSARFFTLTGQHLEGTPTTVCYRPDAVLAIHREVFGDDRTPVLTSASDTATMAVSSDRPVPALELSDDDVICRASESAHNGPRFRRLWDGDTSDYVRDGNAGASEADGALCELLAFYGGPDPERIDRLYRRSGLRREKWDRADYRASTIDLAIRGKTRFYGDSVRPPTPIDANGVPVCTCPGCPNRDDRVHHLERALLDRDDLDEYRQAVIKGERDRRQTLETYIMHVAAVLGRDEAECPSDDKVVLLGFVPWLATHRAKQLASGSPTAFHLAYAAKVVGMHPKRFSKILGRWSSPKADDGAPWYKHVTRTPTVDEDGLPDWDSALEITPYADSPRATWARAMAYVPPERPKKRGGSEHATAHRWGRCENHTGAAIRLDGRCTEGGELVIAVIASADQVDRLKSHFVRSDGTATPTVVAPYLSIAQNGISDGQLELNLQNGISAAATAPPPLFPPELTGTTRVCDVHERSLDAGERQRGQCAWCVDGVPTLTLAPPGQWLRDVWRCPTPGCRSLERRIRADGSWRCSSRGHESVDYDVGEADVGGAARLLPAVSGGSE